MSPALSLTRDDLVRAIARLATRPAVDRAVAERAVALAREIGPAARVVRRGPADYVVSTTDPTAVAEAIARVRGDAP